MNGRVIRESSGTDKEAEARRLLRRREGAAVEGRAIVPRVERIKVADLAEDLRRDYAANGRRSSERMEFCLDHLLPFFGERRAVQVTVADVNAYVARRREEGAANATVNRELCALKRMYSLALVAERIHRAPRIPRLEERNVRQGFFEREQFEALRRHLPEALRAVVTFAYVTGWRTRSEILPLQWRQVDFRTGTIRLEPGTTKNREGRTFVMTPGLRAALEEQRARTEALQRADGADHPLGLPPERAADQVVPPGLAFGVQEGWRPRPDPARLSADRRAQHGAGRRPPLGRDEAGGPPDGGHVPPLRHRGRGHAAGGRRAARPGRAGQSGQSRARVGQSFGQSGGFRH